jgi:hypothetical protein
MPSFVFIVRFWTFEAWRQGIQPEHVAVLPFFLCFGVFEALGKEPDAFFSNLHKKTDQLARSIVGSAQRHPLTIF